LHKTLLWKCVMDATGYRDRRARPSRRPKTVLICEQRCRLAANRYRFSTRGCGFAPRCFRAAARRCRDSARGYGGVTCTSEARSNVSALFACACGQGTSHFDSSVVATARQHQGSSDALGVTSDAFGSAGQSTESSNDAFPSPGQLPTGTSPARSPTGRARMSAAYSLTRTNDALLHAGRSSVHATDACRLTSHAFVASNDVSGSAGHASASAGDALAGMKAGFVASIDAFGPSGRAFHPAGHVCVASTDAFGSTGHDFQRAAHTPIISGHALITAVHQRMPFVRYRTPKVGRIRLWSALLHWFYYPSSDPPRFDTKSGALRDSFGAKRCGSRRECIDFTRRGAW
jgi:hypothetical protein